MATTIPGADVDGGWAETGGASLQDAGLSQPGPLAPSLQDGGSYSSPPIPPARPALTSCRVDTSNSTGLTVRSWKAEVASMASPMTVGELFSS